MIRLVAAFSLACSISVCRRRRRQRPGCRSRRCRRWPRPKAGRGPMRSLFPDVEGYRLRSGWYAIALGPYGGDEARSAACGAAAERMIPGDSFMHDGSGFGEQFWPVGARPVSRRRRQPAPDAGAEVAAGARDRHRGSGRFRRPDRPPRRLAADETPAEARRSEALLSARRARVAADRAAMGRLLQFRHRRRLRPRHPRRRWPPGRPRRAMTRPAC